MTNEVRQCEVINQSIIIIASKMFVTSRLLIRDEEDDLSRFIGRDKLRNFLLPNSRLLL
jgi:hypothetical protein